VYVSPGDLSRIEAFTGRSDFVEDVVAPPEYRDQEDDPAFQRIFHSDGSRRVLRKRTNGDCTFLTPAGCSLPLEVRPLICRLYPFAYTGAGLSIELSEGCPIELLRPGQELLVVLDMKHEQAEEWRAQLYEEIAQEPVTHESRTDLRPTL
jgi:Fe-S-cluster containining protein